MQVLLIKELKPTAGVPRMTGVSEEGAWAMMGQQVSSDWWDVKHRDILFSIFFLNLELAIDTLFQKHIVSVYGSISTAN